MSLLLGWNMSEILSKNTQKKEFNLPNFLLHLIFIFYFFSLTKKNWMNKIFLIKNFHDAHEKKYFPFDEQTCVLKVRVMFPILNLISCTNYDKQMLIILFQSLYQFGSWTYDGFKVRWLPRCHKNMRLYINYGTTTF